MSITDETILATAAFRGGELMLLRAKEMKGHVFFTEQSVFEYISNIVAKSGAMGVIIVLAPVTKYMGMKGLRLNND